MVEDDEGMEAAVRKIKRSKAAQFSSSYAARAPRPVQKVSRDWLTGGPAAPLGLALDAPDC